MGEGGGGATAAGKDWGPLLQAIRATRGPGPDQPGRSGLSQLAADSRAPNFLSSAVGLQGLRAALGPRSGCCGGPCAPPAGGRAFEAGGGCASARPGGGSGLRRLAGGEARPGASLRASNFRYKGFERKDPEVVRLGMAEAYDGSSKAQQAVAAALQAAPAPYKAPGDLVDLMRGKDPDRAVGAVEPAALPDRAA